MPSRPEPVPLINNIQGLQLFLAQKGLEEAIEVAQNGGSTSEIADAAAGATNASNSPRGPGSTGNRSRATQTAGARGIRAGSPRTARSVGRRTSSIRGRGGKTLISPIQAISKGNYAQETFFLIVYSLNGQMVHFESHNHHISLKVVDTRTFSLNGPYIVEIRSQSGKLVSKHIRMD